MDPFPIRVLCVAEPGRLTEEWARILEQQPDLRIVGYLTSPNELIARSRDGVDVVLMDLMMKGRDPLDAVGELNRVYPDVRVIVCNGPCAPDLVARAIDAGAWGFVGRTEEAQRIVDAIRYVARGELVVPEGCEPW